MTRMVRALLLAALVVVAPLQLSGQVLGVLHIKVVLVDAERKPAAVARHVLLISDDPVSAPPRRVVTGPDGTADVRLRPGRYIVESDQPAVLAGTGFVWNRTVEVPAGGEVALELRNDNADVVPVTTAPAAAAEPEIPAVESLLPRWKDSVVALWTPTSRGSGFVVDGRGLVATSQGVVGNAPTVEVQLTPTVKVEGRVVVVDAARDVAIVRIAPTVASGVPAVPLRCDQQAPRIADDQEVVALGMPLRGKVDLTSGRVNAVGSREMVPDFTLATGAAGGPVFTADGTLVGLTSIARDVERDRGDARLVSIAAACEVFGAAQRTLQPASPNGTHLPVEPVTPFPPAALKEAFDRHGANLSPYRMASSDFDVAFITPVMLYAAAQSEGRTKGRDNAAQMDQMRIPQWSDFANWAEYVSTHPSVLLIRVTPKLSESFWTTMARGAAMTQGMSLPAMKRFKAAFGRMRVICGDAEVRPIHPFTLESHLVRGESVREGLYVFDPDALGPQCESAKLAIYSEKDPEHPDTRIVDPGVLRQIWQDFEAYRAQ